MIRYEETGHVFTLETAHAAYQMMADGYGYLQHLHFGGKLGGGSCDGLRPVWATAFSASPQVDVERQRYSLDLTPQEYPTAGGGDYRTPCLSLTFADGARNVELCYASHRILKEKPALEGLPSLHGACETLEITLRDRWADLEVVLLYSVFEEYDVIARSARIVNRTGAPVTLNGVLSACLDLQEDDFDFVHFHGRHAMERMVERTPVAHGEVSVGSVRGTSSHQHNPFVIVCDRSATEDSGRCWGLSFLYSGNFIAAASCDQSDACRVVMGIHPQGFSWRLEDGESFQAPEVALCYSGRGFGALSQSYHKLYRRCLCRGEWALKRRPVLINNWEATYFNFNEEKLFQIAKAASELGVEMLVVDDGWFGNRFDDRRALGDWVVNTEKVRGGMKALSDRLKEIHMRLGLWFEPEMVSEDSNLYRAHPDWCLSVPGRGRSRWRNQLVLDMSRKEVRDFIHDEMAAVLSSADFSYVKWDMNRHLTDVWSAALPADRQGEVYHRYVLGVYELLERMETEFPHILFEGCSGGGGRFDAGMLYYHPQIWCSDNTDAIERLEIQYGSSFGYPISAVGSHVSASPNHQTGRVTPFHTRGVVAMAGTFGYELDLSAITEEEKELVKKQVQQYIRLYDLINDGDYYRLTDPAACCLTAWEMAAPDGSRALLSIVYSHVRANLYPPILRLRGLTPDARYRLTGDDGKVYGEWTGAALMEAGFRSPRQHDAYPHGCADYAAFQIELTRVEG